jgi:hypothetical protein
MSWIVPLAQAWLVATTTFLGLSLGALAVLNICALTGGRWGEVIGPQLRSIARLLPLAMLLMLPLFAAIPVLLPFLGAAPERLPPSVAAKLGYLQPGWITTRTLIVFAIWLAAALLGDVLPVRRTVASKPSSKRAAIGLVLYLLGLLIFTTDWMLALEPEFTSTIYAPMVGVTQIAGAFALAVALRPTSRSAEDFGQLLLSAALAWAYFAFIQWLVVWMGNLPSEAAWYARRTGPWLIPLVVTVAGLAILPFFALLNGHVRHHESRVRAVAAVVVIGYVAENIWRLARAFPLTLDLVLWFAVVHAAVVGGLLLLFRRLPGHESAHV